MPLIVGSVILVVAAQSRGNATAAFRDVVCQGDYQHHLQGVCTNADGAVSWSFTTALVKTDSLGRVLKQISVVNHHGDICFHDGRVYVAVNLGKFNDPLGNADSWVYVYDADTLGFVAKHATPEVFHGAGGIGVMDGRFHVVGGLPDGVEENYVYEYDGGFQFVARHVIKHGSTRLGIQTAAFHDGAWWFGCYGDPEVLLKTDPKFRLLGRYEFDCSVGIVGVAKHRFLVARGPRTQVGRCLGSLHRAHPDPTAGLVLFPRTVLALDAERVQRIGTWSADRFRFAVAGHLHTEEDRAALALRFEGTGFAVRLGGHNVPSYGPPNLGAIVVSIDGEQRRVLRPRALPGEVVLADGLLPGPHSVRFEHHRDGGLAGCRIESFHTWSDPRGEIRFHVSGEEDAFLVDCRVILRRGSSIVRNALVRNWLTGQCSLTGLPPGEDYSLEIRATGWVAAFTETFNIEAGQPTELTPIYLRRDDSTRIHRFRFPCLSQPAIRKAGESFRARFLGFDTKIDQVRLARQFGPAIVSRVVDFEEDRAAAYYYDREVIVKLPPNIPPGAYDLSVEVTGGRRTGRCRSPRSVHVVKDYPTDPTFLTFGHLDTWGQYQSEYLERLVSIANLLAPDMVLCSNAVNPAYISGALSGLDVPYVINFGNHQFPGHEGWYGDPVGLIDCGPHVSVLNFGHPWHVDTSRAEALLASRAKTAIRIINAFEGNAPLDLLDRHRVRMIHDAHGIGKKVSDRGATPTRRVGKTNSESFRVVRFRNNRVASSTYNGHETAPIPCGRETAPPLSVSFSHPNDGTHSRNTATVTNRLIEAFPNGRVRFVVPAGDYDVSGGRVASRILSDDGRFHVITVRVDIPASSSTGITVTPDA